MGTIKIFSALFASVAAFTLLGGAGRAWAQSLPVSVTPTRIEFAGSGGETLKSSVSFWNGTDEWLPIHVGAEDFRPEGEEGHVVVGGEVDEARSLKNWVKPALTDFAVAAGEKLTIDFSLHIPPNASPGSHWGTLVVATEPRPAGGGAAVQIKVGVILLLHVFGDVHEELSVVEMQSPSFGFGLPLPLAVRFLNSGTVHVKPRGMISVFNVFGNLVATTTLPERNVLPGAVRRVEVPVREGLLAGRYTARLQGTYGRQNEIPIAVERSFWFVDWRGVGLPSLILLGVVGFVVWKRRNFRAAFRVLRTGEEAERNVQVAEGKPIRARGEERSEGRKPRRMDL